MSFDKCIHPCNTNCTGTCILITGRTSPHTLLFFLWSFPSYFVCLFSLYVKTLECLVQFWGWLGHGTSVFLLGLITFISKLWRSSHVAKSSKETNFPSVPGFVIFPQCCDIFLLQKGEDMPALGWRMPQEEGGRWEQNSVRLSTVLWQDIILTTYFDGHMGVSYITVFLYVWNIL